MKVNWNFLGGGGEYELDVFWNCTMFRNRQVAVFSQV